MKNYVLLLRVNKNMDPIAFTDPKEVLERAKWLEDMQKSGVVVHLGGTMPPLESMASTIYTDGTIENGPFTEVTHFLTGFLIVKAEDLDVAKTIAESNPILKAGGSVEIREIYLR